MDGKHIDYLDKANVYEAVDPELFSKLRLLVQNRTVAAVQQAGILPAATQFFADRLALDDISALSPKGKALRLARRRVKLRSGSRRLKNFRAPRRSLVTSGAAASAVRLLSD